MTNPLAILIGWLLDFVLGDPQRLPHPVVWFGRAIAFGEHRLNHGSRRMLKGALLSVSLIIATFGITWLLRHLLFTAHNAILVSIFDAVLVFYCLAGTTLIREVRQVFLAVDRSLDEGRRQVARIVGRDTSELSAQEVRTAALETLAENLSDGVVAPLFWLLLLGTPGMMAYKMVNTLDSMIGYRTERYRDFGCWAAHIDDAANYLPARLTALLMVVPFLSPLGRRIHRDGSSPQGGTGGGLLRFVHRYGRCHASPNSGYPEAALAAILDCRFGGPHHYFGQLFDKPYIGHHDRPLTTKDMEKAIRVNRFAEIVMVVSVIICTFAVNYYIL
mgnify:CR=1 FL=1